MSNLVKSITSGAWVSAVLVSALALSTVAAPAGADWANPLDISQNRTLFDIPPGQIAPIGANNTRFQGYPTSIAAGPDGAMWATIRYTDRVVRMTLDGQFTNFDLPGPPITTIFADGRYPDQITAGPDGALWFVEKLGKAIGRITTAGAVTEYPIAGVPQDIVAGPDGALWFTTLAGYGFYAFDQYDQPINLPSGGGSIGRITPSGEITMFPVPTSHPNHFLIPYPVNIVSGPDGALWFTLAGHCLGYPPQIGRITTAGQIQIFPLPASGVACTNGGWMTSIHSAQGLAAGLDGALYVAMREGLARVATDGTVTSLTDPWEPYTLDKEIWNAIEDPVVGPDGEIWGQTVYYDFLIKIPRNGEPTFYSGADMDSYKPFILGPDGAFWTTVDQGSSECPYEEWDCHASILRVDPGGLSLRPALPEGQSSSVPATSIVDVTVTVKNTDDSFVGPVRLILLEGDGVLYAAKDSADPAQSTVVGEKPGVYFDAGVFSAGEQKTFTVPVLLAPVPPTSLDGEPHTAYASPTFALMVDGQIKAKSSVGISVEPMLQPKASALAGLEARPVADVGENPGAVFGGAAFERAPVSAAADNLVFPSDKGDFWRINLFNEVARWEKEDKETYALYRTLRAAKLTIDQAYGFIYLRGLLAMKPSGGCSPKPFAMAKAIGHFYSGVADAKFAGLSGRATDDSNFNQSFASVADAMSNCSPVALLNAIELSVRFSAPLIATMQDRAASFTQNYLATETQVCNYLDVTAPQPMTVPLHRMVEAHIDYYLAHGKPYPKLLHMLNAVRAKNLAGDQVPYGDLLTQIVDPNGPPLSACDRNGLRRGYKGFVKIQVHSPLMPVVTDARGRVAGIDAAANLVHDGIPHVVYQPGHPWVLAVPAAYGPFKVKWTTAYPYGFGVDVQGLSADGSGTVTSVQSHQGTATNGFSAAQDVSVAFDGDKVIVGSSFNGRSGTPMGDFDGDGKSDILWRAVSGPAEGAMFVWLMNGATLSSGTYLDPIPSDWVVQGTGDFNGDGKSDVLWRNMNTISDDAGQLYVWLMDGPKVIAGTGYTSAQADFEWEVQGIGDFDADGKSDIVWRAVQGGAQGAMFLWRMDGTTLKAGTYLDPISTEWQIQDVGDLTGDGRSDILWRNMSASSADAGKLYLWAMNGSTVAAGTGYTNSQADFQWAVQGIGDLDGDGKNDIVWRATSGPSAGAMFLWLMDGATIKGATFLDPISTEWQVQGLGDLNGDGKADVLWRNVNPNVPDASKLFVWIMDGAKVAAGTGYTSSQADASWDVKNPR